ncbi:MAG: Holliday junction resolvase RuvX [Gammaproteobacteria bacterium]|nr:Holliday junction resolvase RuvX [Gammaproteobacteria bacterium]NND53728.1 Holliday junction resolvase RuvX [Gammaproteobacteria bacterium]
MLALDFGLRRIGIASASALSGTASPLTTISARDGEPDWAALDALVAEWRPDLLVLGLPRNIDGSESDMSRRVRAFAALLGERYGIVISLTDERYTSREAEAILKEQRQSGARNRRIKKEDVDSMAATLIAESWLQANKNQP